MSGGIQIEMQNIDPIRVELPEAFPANFTVDFEGGFTIEANFGIPGPPGPAGPPGDVTAASIGELTDVEITNINNGDTLIYSAPISKFINTHQSNLTDGGNF
jgi:hypothetical protein